MSNTPHTDRLMRAAQSRSNAELQGTTAGALAHLHLTGYKAIVEQLELLRDGLAAMTAEIVDVRAELKNQLVVGGSPLGEAIQIQIDDRSIQYSNLADAIAFALEQRGVIR